MSQFFKIIGALVSGLIALAAIGSAGLYGYVQYKEHTFSPIKDVHGAYVGMSRQDFLFYLTDLPMMCNPLLLLRKDCEFFRFADPVTNSYPGGYIRLRNDEVVSIAHHGFIPDDIEHQVYFTEFLLKKLPDPDVLVISRDLTSRTYMYVEEALAFKYRENELSSFNWGAMSLSDMGITSPKGSTDEQKRKLTLEELRRRYGVSETPENPMTLKVPETYGGASVIVDGKQVCPGDTCPFEEGDTFPEFTEMKIYSAEEMRKILRGL